MTVLSKQATDALRHAYGILGDGNGKEWKINPEHTRGVLELLTECFGRELDPEDYFDRGDRDWSDYLERVIRLAYGRGVVLALTLVPVRGTYAIARREGGASSTEVSRHDLRVSDKVLDRRGNVWGLIRVQQAPKYTSIIRDDGAHVVLLGDETISVLRDRS